VQTDDKERARLNCISHLLSVVPWKEIVQQKVKLPKRQKPKGYKDPDWNYRYIPEKY
ncbi:MAG: polyphosphate kinase 2, partial [Acidobacteria bacterium]